jgi:translation initiation factor 2 alpha subunit (eIF-2alpha)
MRHVAETQSVDLFQLYSVIAWPLYKLNGHAHDAFKVRLQHSSPLLAIFQPEQAEILVIHAVAT